MCYVGSLRTHQSSLNVSCVGCDLYMFLFIAGIVLQDACHIYIYICRQFELLHKMKPAVGHHPPWHLRDTSFLFDCPPGEFLHGETPRIRGFEAG